MTCNHNPFLTAPAGRCELVNNVPDCVCGPGFMRISVFKTCLKKSDVCTLGVPTSCDDTPGIGGTNGAGECAPVVVGTVCSCAPGFEVNPATGRCRAALSPQLMAPNLPVIGDISCGPSNGRTTPVPAGGNLQAAIDAAAPGDTLSLQAGATFVGPITLKKKQGTGCITIRTSSPDSALPAPDARISPAQASVLAKIVSPGLNLSAIKTEHGAHHYRLLGLEVTKQSETVHTDVLVDLGDGALRDLADLAHHLEIDRSYVHGLPASPLKFCVLLNSEATTVKNSYISECKMVGFDALAIAGWTGTGKYKIVNNYLEGSGENLMIGGADPVIPNLVPSDIEIRGNHFKKPTKWKVGDVDYGGTPYTVKNLLELKNARRVLIDGNLFEQNWAHAQTGFAIVITVRNQSNRAPWTVTEDITISNNTLRHSAAGIAVSGLDSNFPSMQSRRVSIKNNLIYEIGNPRWGHLAAAPSGWMFQMGRGLSYVTIEHNTLLQTGTLLYLAAPLRGGANLRFANNIALHNTFGVFGEGTGVGSSTLNKYFPGWEFSKNVLISNPYPSNYPADNFNVPGISSVGFTNAAAGDYRLNSASPYRRAATDGTDIGVNLP